MTGLLDMVHKLLLVKKIVLQHMVYTILLLKNFFLLHMVYILHKGIQKNFLLDMEYIPHWQLIVQLYKCKFVQHKENILYEE